ncbi:MAG: hypothetical protein KDD44_15430, partial [Bdellovibrionales bacterium]|nr:hypothetical protein [Bdellovibrionales bacterium]
MPYELCLVLLGAGIAVSLGLAIWFLAKGKKAPELAGDQHHAHPRDTRAPVVRMTRAKHRPQMELLAAGAPIPLVIDALFDRSTSIRGYGLVGAVRSRGAMLDDFVIANPLCRIRRSMFSGTQVWIDTDFVSADTVRKSPFDRAYQIGPSGTHLDEYMLAQLEQLLERFDGAGGTGSEAIHVLWINTDGENNGRDYSRRIRSLMQRV